MIPSGPFFALRRFGLFPLLVGLFKQTEPVGNPQLSSPNDLNRPCVQHPTTQPVYIGDFAEWNDEKEVPQSRRRKHVLAGEHTFV